MSRLGPVAFDVVLVIVFAAIGRRSHDHGLNVAGVLETAAPFVCGAAVGWLVAALVTDLTPRSPWFGLIVAVGAVVVGMALRALFGAPVAWSFVAVAFTALTVFLVGWRAIAALLASRG